MAITASQVNELRKNTGVGMMTCKKALEEAGGDLNKALDILRKKGQAKALKRQDREVTEGFIGYYQHANGKIATLVKLGCETDFVSMNEDFKALARDLAMHVAAMNPTYLNPEAVPTEIIEKEKEIILEQLKAENKPAEVIEKIVTGKINKYYEENCLTNQKYVKDDSKKVDEIITENIAKMGENIVISDYSRLSIG